MCEILYSKLLQTETSGVKLKFNICISCGIDLVSTSLNNQVHIVLMITKIWQYFIIFFTMINDFNSGLRP